MSEDDRVIYYTAKLARRLLIGLVGFTILLLGVALIVLPGPAIVVIPVGLGILALEFAWARHLLHRIRARVAHFTGRRY